MHPRQQRCEASLCFRSKTLCLAVSNASTENRIRERSRCKTVLPVSFSRESRVRCTCPEGIYSESRDRNIVFPVISIAWNSRIRPEEFSVRKETRVRSEKENKGGLFVGEQNERQSFRCWITKRRQTFRWLAQLPQYHAGIFRTFKGFPRLS